jgi:transcriptional regulator with XRE-family HTH domain
MKPPLTLNLAEVLIVARQNETRTGESFGERLRRLRKARGFTQTELARSAGTSQRMITHYERHDGVPGGPVVVRLADALGITPEELLGIRQPRRKKTAESPENLRLWRKLRQVESLTPSERRDVLRYIEALVERSQLKKEKSG